MGTVWYWKFATLHSNPHSCLVKLGGIFCKVLLKAYIGTGCDWLSKIGTKKGGVAANPEIYLADFAENCPLSDDDVMNCETCLVKVLSLASSRPTLDGLGLKKYLRTKSVLELPPTSYSVLNGHIPIWSWNV